MKQISARSFPVPSFDNLRVRLVHTLETLDTTPNPLFDELVRLASMIAETPIAALCVVDIDRVWLKAKIGLSVYEAPRENSFSAHAILDPVIPFIIEDATKSEAFKANPLVLGELNLRAYAGFPINAPNDGLTIASLCVMDRIPRRFTNQQLKLLSEVARLISVSIAQDSRK